MQRQIAPGWLLIICEVCDKEVFEEAGKRDLAKTLKSEEIPVYTTTDVVQANRLWRMDLAAGNVGYRPVPVESLRVVNGIQG